MNRYISETEYAVKNLIDLVVREEKKIEELTHKLSLLMAQYKVDKWDFETSDSQEDFSDAYIQAAFHRMAKSHKQVSELEREINLTKVLIDTRQFAIQSICGAILQIAKQGISVEYSGVRAAPSGRNIGTLKIKDVIWQAKNQAIHFEEGSLRQQVTDVFLSLEREFGTEFSLVQHQNKSRAKQVIYLLGWNDYASYSSDMQSILP